MSGAWLPVLHPRALPRDGGATLTLQAWLSLPEDVAGELVDGGLREEELAEPIHELAVTWLIALFRTWLSGRGGFVFGSDVKLALSEKLGRKPDVAVYLPGSPPPPRRGGLRRPPDILVEVVSPSPKDERRDRVEKMDEYARWGASQYWLVDPALGSLEIFVLSGGAYAKARAATFGSIDVPDCDGLTVDVDALWQELDRLGDED